jgi:RimJ/RimL family protein N-acetyltransferase
MITLESERTELRFYVPTDVDEIVRLHTDPDVVRYLVDAAPSTSLHATIFIRLITEAQNKNPGLGIWRTSLKTTGEFIGNFSLMRLAGTDDIEIGGRLLKHAWGGGYSMEVAHALLDYAFARFDVPRIVSMAHPANRAAASALIATGFLPAGIEHHYERDLPFFVITRERWQWQRDMQQNWRDHARRNLREASRQKLR